MSRAGPDRLLLTNGGATTFVDVRTAAVTAGPTLPGPNVAIPLVEADASGDVVIRSDVTRRNSTPSGSPARPRRA